MPEIKAHIPFSQGAQEIIAWYDADPARQVTDVYFDALQDRIIGAVEGLFPSK